MLPDEILATVQRSNDAKQPNALLLYPYLAKHEGSVSTSELFARVLGANAAANHILCELHERMIAFGLWRHIRLIVNVYTGVGTRGLFFEPFDHEAMRAHLVRLTARADNRAVPSRFCRDAFSVHGPRDSFREMVKHGPGLHICITRPAFRASEPCDLHIDQVQQGQMCVGGVCVPRINGQTIRHLRAVGPWLVRKAQDRLKSCLEIGDARYMAPMPKGMGSNSAL